MANQPNQYLRRTPVAVLVGFVCAGLFGAALGAANAATASDTNTLPESLSVPAPHLGDRWTYTATLSGAWDYQSNDTVHDGENPTFAAFELRAEPALRAADGKLHDAYSVAVTSWNYAPYHFPDWVKDNPRRSWQSATTIGFHATGDHENLALQNHVDDSWSSNVAFPTDEVPLYSQDSTVRMKGDLRYFGGPALCLGVSTLQGKTTTLAGASVAPTDCVLGGYLALQADQLLTPTRAAMVNGHAAVLFATADGLTGLWYSSEIPYPVRVEQSIAATHDGEERLEIVLDLTGFESGSDPLPTQAAVEGSAADILFAAPKPWGPDDAGTKAVFPLSVAYTKARDDVTFTTMRDYLAAHPKAVTSQATLSVFTDDDGTTGQEWRFFLEDRTSRLNVVATHAMGNYPVAALDEQYTFSASEFPSDGDLDADRMPKQMPTIASAERRWADYAPADAEKEGPNGYNFHIACADEDCKEVYLNLAAGQGALKMARTSTPGWDIVRTGSYSSTATSDGYTLFLDLAGTTMGVSDMDSTATASERVAGIGSPAATQAQGAQGVHAVTGLRASAWLPTPSQATGASVIGTLVGLLYFAWPILKSGGLAGLFSRMQPDDVLDHPARSQLLELVRASPGVHYRDLLRATGLSKGSLEHHLRVLEEQHAVKAVRTPRYTCYFPADAARAAMVGAGAAKADGAKRILEALRGKDGMTGRELADRTGLAPSTVSEHTTKLAAAGLVGAHREGRTVVFRASAGA